jgi:hypothetical protein
MGTAFRSSLRRAFSSQGLGGQEARRPTVKLSAAPRMKHKGKTIGKTYPVTPYGSSGEMEIPSYCNNLPDYAVNKAILSTYIDAMQPATLVDAEELQQMSTLQALLRKVLQKASSLSCAGNTTDAIDKIVFNTMMLQGMYPSTLKYKSYEKSTFASCNELVFGGIPDSRPLQIGDLVTYHVWCHDRGVHANAATTVLVTEPALHPVSNDASSHYSDDEDELLDQNDEMERSGALRTHVQQAMVLAVEKCVAAAEAAVTIGDVTRLILDYANQHGYQWVRNVDEALPLRQALSTVPSLQVRTYIKRG